MIVAALALQVGARHWPASAVHDTVQAVVRAAEFRRSLRQSIMERVLLWIGELVGRLVHLVRVTPSARWVALGLASLIVLLVVARLTVAARARNEEISVRGRGRTVAAGEDPWRLAERLERSGDFEGAVHALYRAVLLALADADRVRLDPSRTSGDYARELRRRGSPRHAPFRAFARVVDEAVYGHRRPDASLLARLRRLAGPLSPAARAA